MTLDDLTAYGANVQDGLQRCMGMEDFYIRLVESVKGETGFDSLRAALEAGDFEAAFSSAHALKGILANLSLTPMLEPVSELTELLRPHEPIAYEELLGQVMDAHERFMAL